MPAASGKKCRAFSVRLRPCVDLVRGKLARPNTGELSQDCRSLTHCRYSFCGSMMKRMSFSETIFLFLLALIIFGPKKLPGIARQAGKWMNEFRRASNEFKAQIEQEISNLEIENRKPKILPPSPPLEGTASRTLNAAPSGPSQAEAPPAEAKAAEISPAPEAATPATSDDEPLFAKASADTPAAATEATRITEAVTASTSQESHV